MMEKPWAHASTANTGLQYGWNDGSNVLNRTGLAPEPISLRLTDASACVRADTRSNNATNRSNS